VFEISGIKAIFIPKIRFVQKIDKLTILKEWNFWNADFQEGKSVCF